MQGFRVELQVSWGDGGVTGTGKKWAIQCQDRDKWAQDIDFSGIQDRDKTRLRQTGGVVRYSS